MSSFSCVKRHRNSHTSEKFAQPIRAPYYNLCQTTTKAAAQQLAMDLMHAPYHHNVSTHHISRSVHSNSQWIPYIQPTYYHNTQPIASVPETRRRRPRPRPRNNRYSAHRSRNRPLAKAMRVPLFSWALKDARMPKHTIGTKPRMR
jgi:hypothetical protein